MPIPREKTPDSTLALLADGYTFISKRCRRYNTDVFATRLMLRDVVCTRGEDAARMFYHPGRFSRKHAMPPTALKLLQDKGSVQLLHGDAHRRRKEMFLSLMTPAAIQRLIDISTEEWRKATGSWQTRETIILHDAVEAILCRAICRWAGVPLTEPEARARTEEFDAMIDGAGAVGPRNWRGMLLRSRTERWGRGIIERLRAGELNASEDRAAHIIAWHRNLDGEPLDPQVAAVELINVLRPTVAVAWYVTFAALALHDYPDWRQRLEAGAEQDVEWFVQEVRRFYPFFPVIGGVVQEAFGWRDHRFTSGIWVLLDLYGVQHDKRIWGDPEVFRPERFGAWNGSPFNFVPQGGGDYGDGHRCPGEWITIALLKNAVCSLTRSMRYEVPQQDLGVDLSRMPALPASRFVIRNVRDTNSG